MIQALRVHACLTPTFCGLETDTTVVPSRPICKVGKIFHQRQFLHFLTKFVPLVQHAWKDVKPAWAEITHGMKMLRVTKVEDIFLRSTFFRDIVILFVSCCVNLFCVVHWLTKKNLLSTRLFAATLRTVLKRSRFRLFVLWIIRNRSAKWTSWDSRNWQLCRYSYLCNSKTSVENMTLSLLMVNDSL